ncbi:MAG TPA: hypothetical protein PKI32_06265, partial [Opitutales bacterium]|nr:hypothetical protein [Opitutales bacterium]
MPALLDSRHCKRPPSEINPREILAHFWRLSEWKFKNLLLEYFGPETVECVGSGLEMPAEMAFGSPFGEEGRTLQTGCHAVLCPSDVHATRRIHAFRPVEVHELHACIANIRDFRGYFVLQVGRLIDITTVSAELGKVKRPADLSNRMRLCPRSVSPPFYPKETV